MRRTDGCEFRTQPCHGDAGTILYRHNFTLRLVPSLWQHGHMDFLMGFPPSKGSPFLVRRRRVLPRPPAQMPRRPLQGLRRPALALPEETGVRSSCGVSAQRSRNSQQCPPSPSPKGQPSGEKEEVKIQELKVFKSASFELCNGQVCATVWPACSMGWPALRVHCRRVW